MPKLRDHTTIDSRIYARRRGRGAARYYGVWVAKSPSQCRSR